MQNVFLYNTILNKFTEYVIDKFRAEDTGCLKFMPFAGNFGTLGKNETQINDHNLRGKKKQKKISTFLPS